MFRCSVQCFLVTINKLSWWKWKHCIEIFHLGWCVATIMWWWFGSKESFSFTVLFSLFSIYDSSLVYENLKISYHFFLIKFDYQFFDFFLCSFEFLFEMILFSILSFNILFNLILISNLVIIFLNDIYFVLNPFLNWFLFSISSLNIWFDFILYQIWSSFF